MEEKQPWWATDPELKEIIRRSNEELFGKGYDLRAFDADGPDPDDTDLDGADLDDTVSPVRDPVLAEIWSGACRRALADARDGLERARQDYDDAVRAARTAGYSWGEIGAILGVSRQALHRRFVTGPA